MQISLDHPLERLALIGKSQHPQRIGEGVPGDRGEILVASHQRAQPGVFELLDAPDLRDDPAIARKRILGDLSNRLDVVQRPVGVEHDGFDAQRTGPPDRCG
jgi:hypothetical protein